MACFSLPAVLGAVDDGILSQSCHATALVGEPARSADIVSGYKDRPTPESLAILPSSRHSRSIWRIGEVRQVVSGYQA